MIINIINNNNSNDNEVFCTSENNILISVYLSNFFIISPIRISAQINKYFT